MTSVAPNLFVNDIEGSIAFYEGLGFGLAARVPDEGPCVWAMMTNGPVTFMFQTLESLGDDLPQVRRELGASALFYVSLKGIREFFAKIEGTGAVVKELERTFYNATEFTIVDNSGYVITFAEHDE